MDKQGKAKKGLKFKMLAMKSQEIYRVPLNCVDEFNAMANKSEQAFTKFLREYFKEEEENDNENKQ